MIVMRHAGSEIDSLRATIGTAAKLTVDEHNGTRFVPWKAFSRSAVASVGRSNEVPTPSPPIVPIDRASEATAHDPPSAGPDASPMVSEPAPLDRDQRARSSQ